MSTHEFAAFEALDLAPIKMKLMHVESGEGWSALRADAVETEYRRFLFLMKKYPDAQASPTVDVDTFWHYHILDTMKYARDCEAVFGYFLHHYPYVGIGAGADETEQVRAGERMRQIYEAEFGAEPANQAAWCTSPGKGLDTTAWCTSPGKRVDTSAWCTSPGKGLDTTAWCTSPGKRVDTSAWCTSPGKQLDTSAWCTSPGKRIDASAWCTAPGKQLNGRAWCTSPGKPAGASASAWCTSPGKRLDGSAWCTSPGRKLDAANSPSAWCTAPGQQPRADNDGAERAVEQAA